MKKRILALLTIFALVCTSAPLTVLAEKEEETKEEVKEEKEPRSEVELLSTATQTDLIEDDENVDADIEEAIEALIPEDLEDIYIGSVDDFLAFANNCKLDTWSVNKRVILTQDLSLLGKDFDFVPSFGGIFDGQGHTISEYNVSDGLSHVGLFAEVQKTGIIANLSVSGSIIPSGEQIRVGGLCGENHGYIKNCSFKGVISSNDYVGGITSYNHFTGIIEDCDVSGYIKGIHFVGGVAGYNEGDISRCRNDSLVNTTNVDTQITIDSMTNLNKVINLIKNVDSTSEEANEDATATDVGGIAGNSLGIISRCLNMGNVGYEHVGYNIGGIVGRQSGYAVNCTNNGKVLGRKDVGGIVGQAEPYITVDLSSDIAYQLTESIGKLHDTVSATLGDAKNQSDVITNRLSAIQQFTSGAIEDVRFLSAGTVDFANGVSSATSEAFSRVDYILDETSKDDGVLDQLTYAASDTRSSADSFENAVSDLNLDNYLSDGEKQDYQNAKDTIKDAASIYSELYSFSYKAYYNYYILKEQSINPFDLVYQDGNGHRLTYNENVPTFKADFTDSLEDDYKADPKGDSYGLRQDGTWVHTTDPATSFPVSDSEDPRYQDDASFNNAAIAHAQNDADEFARENYNNPTTGSKGSRGYTDDLQSAGKTILTLTSVHMDEMTDAARADAVKSMDSLESASSHLSEAGKQTKSIVRNVAGREDIAFPQFSAEYKDHTASLASNMAGMNDNFGSLNLEVNNATGVLVDDLQSIADQFNNIMMLYTDAIDGVLEMDYTQAYSDVSLEEASTSTDATIEGCQNFGRVEGDIDTAGIAGTMAIEYDYDKESDLTGIKDSKLNSSFITKCVLRSNKNYAEAVGEKNYAAGICGLQEMGTILGCSNYSNIKSSSGDYVGGVTGASYSYVVSSFSKGILEGANYVGGIAGDGNNIRNCLALVDIKNAESRFGAIAGNVEDGAEIRNNFFVSDDLAGIDKISYSKKAEPVEYDKVLQGNLFEAEKVITVEDALSEEEGQVEEKTVKLDTVQYSDVPNDFKKLMVTFVLEDDDLEGGREIIAKVKKNYGESIAADEYPGLKNKDGFYAAWDTPELTDITTDKVVTATYKRYRTTLSEYNASDDLKQSELLVDGMFKEDDELGIVRTINFVEGKAETLKDYETLDVTIPNDGQSVHQIRFRPISEATIAIDLLKGYLGDQYRLYQIKDGEKILLTPTGTMGKYSTYDIEGNKFTLSLDVGDAKGATGKIAAFFVAIFLLVVVLIAVAVILITKHTRHVPKIINKLISKVSARIESKEQLFYDDSKDMAEEDASKKGEDPEQIKETEKKE